MATEVGSIYYDLDLDSKKFETGINAANTKAGDLSTNLTNQFQGASNASQAFATGILAVGAAVAAAGGFALKSAGDYQQNRVAFETMLGSADKAKVLLKQISDFAASTPFQLPDVVEGGKKLLAFGISGDQVISTFRTLGNIAAAVGTDKLPGLINVFGQVKAAGRLMSQDLLQFTSAGVPIIDELAAHFGVAKEKVKDMVAAGKVGFGDVQAALEQLGGPAGKWGDLMAKQSLTFQGTLSNVSDNIGRVARQIVGMDSEGNIKEGSIFAQVTDAANQFLTFLSTHTDDIVKFFNQTFGFLVKNGPMIIGIIAGGLTPAFIALAISIGSNMLALAPFVAVGLALGFAWQKNKLLFTVLAGVLAGFAVGIMVILWPAIWGSVVAFGAMAVAVLAATWPFILIGGIIAGAAYLIVTHWKQISGFFSKLWNDVVGFFKNNWKLILAIMFPMLALPLIIFTHWKQIVAWFGKIWDDVVKGIGDFITGAISWFAALPMNIAFMLGLIVGHLVKFIIIDIPNFFVALYQWFIALPGNIFNFMVSMYNTITTWFGKAFNTAVSWTANLVNGVIGWFMALPGRVWDAVVAVYNTVVNWFGNTVNAAGTAGSNLVNGFIGFIKDLPSKVLGIFNDVVSTISNFGAKLWDKAKDIAGSFWNGFKKGLGIASPSYVERAFMAIGTQSTATLNQMKTDVGKLQSLGGTLASMPRPIMGGSTMANSANSMAGSGGPSSVTVNLTGVLADSPTAKRDLGMQIVDAINQNQRATGSPQLLGGTS